MNQKKYWDRVAEKKEFTISFPLKLFAELVSTDSQVIDVGCGYGRTLDELRRAGYRHLSGFDFSSRMLERGRRLYPELSLREMRGLSLPLPACSCDAALLVAVLTCIVDGADEKRLLREIERVLRPGGVVLIADFLLNDDPRNIERYELYAGELGVYGAFVLSDGAVLRHRDPRWAADGLAMFVGGHYEETVFTTMNGNASNGFYFCGRKRQTNRLRNAGDAERT